MTVNLERGIRQVALVVDRELVMRTPVDTGRAKANWLPTVGAPSEDVTDDLDTTGQATIAKAESVVNGWRLGQGSIFISNGLPYIDRLDKGWSGQAPEGMTEFAMDAARRTAKRLRLLR